MTPAEMREAAAAMVERCEWYATASLGRLAAAIRALPLADPDPFLRRACCVATLDAAAALVDALDDGDDHRDVTWSTLAREIRALPLAEGAPLTPREKLRRVREAERYRVATVHGRRVYAAPAAKDMIGWWFQWEKTSGKWVGRTMESAGSNAPCPEHSTEEAARTWVLDTLRAEGWDVVEEGEGDD